MIQQMAAHVRFLGITWGASMARSSRRPSDIFLYARGVKDGASGSPTGPRWEYPGELPWRDQARGLWESSFMASGESVRASGRPTGGLWEYPGELPSRDLTSGLTESVYMASAEDD